MHHASRYVATRSFAIRGCLIAVEDVRRRRRLIVSHRTGPAGSHRLPGYIRSHHAPRRARKQASRFWPMSFLVSLLSYSLSPPYLSLSLSLVLSWSPAHTVPHATDKVKVVSLHSSTSSFANLLQVCVASLSVSRSLFPANSNEYWQEY